MTGWKLKLTIAAVLLCAPLSARAEDKVCSTMIKGAAEIGYTLAADEYAVVSYLLFQSVQTTTVTYGPGQRVAKTFSNPNMAANPWVYFSGVIFKNSCAPLQPAPQAAPSPTPTK